MRQKTVYAVAGISLLLLACCVFGAIYFSSGFPDSLFGQNNVSPDFRPYPPTAYQSAEFVLGQVPLSEVERAFWFQTGEETLFWDPYYVGFPRAEPSREELAALLGMFRQAVLFHTATDGGQYECVSQQRLGPCIENVDYGKVMAERRWAATKNHGHAALVLFLKNKRLVEIHLAVSPQGVAFTPFEKGGDWWLDGLAQKITLVDNLARRAKTPKVAVLWPELEAEAANQRAAARLGERYVNALEFVRESPAVLRAFGALQEIRPAQGNNYTSEWMDSRSIFLTLSVSGSLAQGVVLMQGDACFDLQMVVGGQWMDDGKSYYCP